MTTVRIPDNSSLELSPNSHKYHEEQKAAEERQKVESVIDGEAGKKKPSKTKKVKEALIGDAEEVKSYLLWDVLIPAVKDTMVDLIKAFAEGIFHSAGSGSRNQYVQRNGQRSYVSYSSYGDGRRNSRYRYYDGPGERPRAQGSYNSRAALDFDEVLYKKRSDAEKVMNAMARKTVECGMVSVADMYEYSKLDSAYTDIEYGWYEIDGAYVDRVRDGYVIRLPRPERLD